MLMQPYVFFDGRCEEAIDFYKNAIGAKTEMLMRWKDCPDKSAVTPQNADKVMHACLQVGDMKLLASDGRCEGKPDFKGFALTLSAKTEAEVDKLFGALSNGGQVQMPLTKTFFSPKFGMCADKFGVGWMVMVESAPPK
jgi:PhnB protein